MMNIAEGGLLFADTVDLVPRKKALHKYIAVFPESSSHFIEGCVLGRWPEPLRWHGRALVGADVDGHDNFRVC